MLSKEEIEKAKEDLLEIKEDSEWDLQHKSSRTDEEINLANKYSKSIETLLQYIDQLEQENNKQSKMIDEMVEQLVGWAIFDGELQKPIILYTEEQVKQYFEKKVEGK